MGTILVGSIGVGAILKVMGFSESQEAPNLVILVRNWGFVLILIPVMWVFMTLWMELHHAWYSKRLTLLSGLLLLASLIWFFAIVASRAASVLIQMDN